MLVEVERNMKMFQDENFGEVKVGVTNDIGAYFASEIINKCEK